jgi:Flp pilus assembly protein TadD
MRVISWLVVLSATSVLWAQSAGDAIEAFHRGHYSQARQMFEKIVATSPSDAQARTFLALSRAATGGCAAATNDLQQQFKSNSDPALRRLAGIALVQCHFFAKRL